MFELSVLPADVDSQTLSVVLQCLFLTVFTHFLCVLGFLHLDETLKTDRQTVQSVRRVTQTVRQTQSVRQTVQSVRQTDGSDTVSPIDGSDRESCTSLFSLLVKYFRTCPNGSASFRMSASENLLVGISPM